MYGGFSLAFRPDGDASGPSDGFSGSLFAVGKQQGGSSRRDVSEFTIPQPVNSSNLTDLNSATTLQPVNDLTGGLFDKTLAGHELNQVRGLVYLDAQTGQNNAKMYWSIWSAYNTEDVNLPSQGYSDLTISTPNEQGVWKLAGYTSKIVSGYLFEIPKNWSDTHIGGKYIGTGISREGGAFARGPALFTIAPYKYNNSNPPPNNELPTIPLIFYDIAHDNYPNYVSRDLWTGGAWITDGTKSAVVFAGSKCMGEVCYGTGDYCNDQCNTDKGYHCTPMVPQMVFYDVNDLEQVAAGAKKPWDPQPYGTLNLTELIPGYCGTCTEMQGLAYDRAHGLLYLIQFQGDGAKPLIHALGINAGQVLAVPHILFMSQEQE